MATPEGRNIEQRFVTSGLILGREFTTVSIEDVRRSIGGLVEVLNRVEESSRELYLTLLFENAQREDDALRFKRGLFKNPVELAHFLARVNRADYSKSQKTPEEVKLGDKVNDHLIALRIPLSPAEVVGNRAETSGYWIDQDWRAMRDLWQKNSFLAGHPDYVALIGDIFTETASRRLSETVSEVPYHYMESTRRLVGKAAQGLALKPILWEKKQIATNPYMPLAELALEGFRPHALVRLPRKILGFIPGNAPAFIVADNFRASA